MGNTGDAWDVLRVVTVWGPNFPCSHPEPVKEPWAPLVTPVAKQPAIPEDAVLAYHGSPARGTRRGPGTRASSPPTVLPPDDPPPPPCPLAPAVDPTPSNPLKVPTALPAQKSLDWPLARRSQPSLLPPAPCRTHAPASLCSLMRHQCYLPQPPVTLPPVPLARSQRGDRERSDLEPSCALPYRTSLGKSPPL